MESGFPLKYAYLHNASSLSTKLNEIHCGGIKRSCADYAINGHNSMFKRAEILRYVMESEFPGNMYICRLL